MSIETLATPGLSELRLMQLVSPALPVGGYTYSQGLEWAVEADQVTTEEDVSRWLEGLILDGLTWLELPVLREIYEAVQADEQGSVGHWADFLLACRETAELRQEEINRGRALATLLDDLGIEGVDRFRIAMDKSQMVGFALAAVQWKIPLFQAALGLGWSWLENQVSAAVKLVPLGQTAGQRIQLELAALVADAIPRALQVPVDEIGASAPAMAIASSHHETQYTRLFRS